MLINIKEKCWYFKEHHIEVVPFNMSEELLNHYNKYNKEHAEMIIYEGQPPVFTGPYKLKDVENIYKFIKNNII